MRTPTQRFPLWASQTHVEVREAHEQGRLRGACEGSPGGCRSGEGASEREGKDGKSESMFITARCRPPSMCPRVSQPPGCSRLQPCRNTLLRCSLHSWCLLMPNLQHMRQSFPANPSEHTHTPSPPPLLQPLKGVVFPPAITKVCFCFEYPVFAC